MTASRLRRGDARHATDPECSGLSGRPRQAWSGRNGQAGKVYVIQD